MKQFRMVKQGLLDGGICAGCVAAIITNTTLDEFCEWYGSYIGPFETRKVFEYLNNHGIIPGFSVNSIIPIRDCDNRLIGYKIDIPLDQSAFGVVVTPGAEATHAIFFDGHFVWDPHNAFPTLNLETYQVVSWTPLYFPPEPSSEIAMEPPPNSRFIVADSGSIKLTDNQSRVGPPGVPCAVTIVRKEPDPK